MPLRPTCLAAPSRSFAAPVSLAPSTASTACTQQPTAAGQWAAKCQVLLLHTHMIVIVQPHLTRHTAQCAHRSSGLHRGQSRIQYLGHSLSCSTAHTQAAAPPACACGLVCALLLLATASVALKSSYFTGCTGWLQLASNSSPEGFGSHREQPLPPGAEGCKAAGRKEAGPP